MKGQIALWGALVGVGVSAAALMASAPSGEAILGKFSTGLAARTRNQRHNAVLAAQFLDGATIESGQTLSFNERVGSWSRDVGYRKAPVSYNGQLVPSWGGGVCQTSTTLYNAALLAGLEVVERHPHRFATGYCPPGRDAAVAFSGIDLKLRNPFDFAVRVHAYPMNGSLVVEVLGLRPPAVKPRVLTEVRQVSQPSTYTAGGGGWGRVRNTGKPGFEVATYQVVGSAKQLISVDTYPVVHRIVEYR